MNSKPRLRILLADDHLVVRMGISSILSCERDFEVVGEADNGADAIRLARELKPDIVIMDLMMPKTDGATATADIVRESPSVRVLILTTFTTSQDLRRAMSAGAAGALVKTSSQDELLDALRKIAAGEHVISGEIARFLRMVDKQPELTTRQSEVLGFVAKGFTNVDIGRMLGISVNGVKDHLKQVFARLGVASRAEAATLATALGLIPDAQSDKEV